MPLLLASSTTISTPPANIFTPPSPNLGESAPDIQSFVSEAVNVMAVVAAQLERSVTLTWPRLGYARKA